MIPHTLHFVWVGPQDVPTEVVAVMQAWRDRTGFDVWLHSDRERDLPHTIGVSTRGIESMINRPIVDHIIGNLPESMKWAAVSDLLRVEVVLQNGGVYLDVDVFPIAPQFDLLLSDQTLVVSEEYSGKFVGNFFFASVPNHPALHRLVCHTRDLYHQAWQSRGPNMEIIYTTGPRPFERTVLNYQDCTRLAYPVLSPWRWNIAAPSLEDWLTHFKGYKGTSQAAHVWRNRWGHPASKKDVDMVRGMQPWTIQSERGRA